jgi:hypothetical protein
VKRRLCFSAAEVVAFQNAAGRRDARLPVKSMHIVPAYFDARRSVTLRGDRVQEIYKDWLRNASASLPFLQDEPYRVVEPVDHAGRPRATALRDLWLGKPQVINGNSRDSRAAETRFTAYIAHVELARVDTLKAEQLLACGLRKTESGWSHGDSGTSFGSELLAFADHWKTSFPDVPWAENPWAWVLHLDAPVEHRGEQEALRVARRLLNTYQKEELRLEKAELALRRRRASLRSAERQVCRVLRTHCEDRQMHVDGFVAHFDQEFLTKTDPVPERTKEHA